MKNTFLGFFETKNVIDIQEKGSILLFGIPFERAKTTKGGSKKAPSALRKQSLEFSGISSDFNIDEIETNFYDIGNIDPIKQENYLKEIWNQVIKLNLKILVLGGDHSITYDTLIKAPWDKESALIWIDAHPDLADEYPTGVFKSHGTVFTNLKNELQLEKNQMLLIGGHAYTITSAEFWKVKNKNVTNYISTRELIEKREDSLEIIKKFVSNFKTIYLSVDADALDQSFVPTVATKEPFGITPNLLNDILNILVPKAKYIDFVEIRYKRRNKTALNFGVGLIFRILELWTKKL